MTERDIKTIKTYLSLGYRFIARDAPNLSIYGYGEIIDPLDGDLFIFKHLPIRDYEKGGSSDIWINSREHNDSYTDIFLETRLEDLSWDHNYIYLAELLLR